MPHRQNNHKIEEEAMWNKNQTATSSSNRENNVCTISWIHSRFEGYKRPDGNNLFHNGPLDCYHLPLLREYWIGKVVDRGKSYRSARPVKENHIMAEL